MSNKIFKRKRDTEVAANIVVKQLKYQKLGTTTVLKKLVFHRTDAVQSHGTSVDMHKKKIPSSLVRKETSGLVYALGMNLKKAKTSIVQKVRTIKALNKQLSVVTAQLSVAAKKDTDTHNKLVLRLQRRDVTIKEKNGTIKEKNGTIKHLKTEVSSQNETIKHLKTKILRGAKEADHYKKQFDVVKEAAIIKMEDISAQVIDKTEVVEVLEQKLNHSYARINFLEEKLKVQEENISKMREEQGNMNAQRQILKKAAGSGSIAKVQNIDLASQSNAKEPPSTVGDLSDDKQQQVREYVISTFLKKIVIAKCPELELLAQNFSIEHGILLRHVYRKRSKIMAHSKRFFPVTPVQSVTCTMVRCFLAVTHLNRIGDGCSHPEEHMLASHDRCDAPNCPFCLHVHGQETL